MSDWTDGYVAEIDYTHGFYRELTPSFLAFCMLLAGIRPPSLSAPFSYCELGCGQGFSTNLIASANRGADFWATDFNPSHTVGAQRLAEAAGAGNVRFFDQSFAEFLDLDTPGFDFITLHGIYSWISPENRATIVEIIRRKLKPGGVVYISYNCLPGWSAAMPMRQLLIEHAAGSTDAMPVRIDKAIEFAKQIGGLNAGYFSSNPTVPPKLERLQGMSRNYLAHEYFNREWKPQYFAEVSRELAHAKLTFASSASPTDHVDVVNLSADAQKILAGIGDVTFRETVRDYFLNQQFRKDIFVKGAVRLSSQEQAEFLMGTRFALTAPRPTVPLSARFAVGDVTLQSETYTPVLDALAGGPLTLGALLEDSRIGHIGYPRVLQALTILVALGAVAPALPAGGDGERALGTAGFNRAVMERARFSSELSSLASPVTGGGVGVTRSDQLFLLASKFGADPAEFAWQALSAQGQRLMKDGKVLQSTEDNLSELQTRAAIFQKQTLPLLRQLGIS
ncbi:SAM-dependent methyltransferase [Skermanella aerolata]|uniref:class I SAM-dependent methyltransferase n=1 Tax=Skermanella aerolata TaxID=393310 RepID=UPI003D253D66